jgi:hypothetical protein
MEKPYYVWSTTMAGWASNSGPYTSELTDAKVFSRAEAEARCILHYRQNDGQFGLIPVSVDDIMHIVELAK